MAAVSLYQAAKVHYIDAAACARIVSKPADTQTAEVRSNVVSTQDIQTEDIQIASILAP